MATESRFHDLRDDDGTLSRPVHTEASWLLLRLEARGILVAADCGHLVVTPKGALTLEERDTLRRLKPHVLQLMAYRAPEVH